MMRRTKMIGGALSKGRPFLMVGVGHCEDWLVHVGGKKDGPLEQAVRAQALISTGQMVTSISERILKQAGLELLVSKTLPKRVREAAAYCVSLALLDGGYEDPAPLVLRKVLVVSHPHASQDAPIILGADVLMKMTLHMDGPSKSFTLEG